MRYKKSKQMLSCITATAVILVGVLCSGNALAHGGHGHGGGGHGHGGHGHGHYHGGGNAWAAGAVFGAVAAGIVIASSVPPQPYYYRNDCHWVGPTRCHINKWGDMRCHHVARYVVC